MSGTTTGLRNRLARGLGATALGPVVTAAIQLGTVPLLVHAWGVAKYGDWLVLSAIPSYFSLSDLGFGDASGSDMTVRVASGDRAGALRTFQSSWVLLLLLSAIVLALAGSLVWWFPWQQWLHLSSVTSSQAALILFVLATYIVATQQNGVLESGYRCDGNFATGTLFIILLRFAEAVVALAVGVWTGQLLPVAVSYLVVRVLGTVAFALLLRKRSPWLQLGFEHARLSAVKQLGKPALGFVALPLGNAISLQGFTVLIGAMLGPVMVAAFSTLRTLTRFSFQLLNVVSWTVWPELSRAFGAKNLPLARQLHRHAYQAGIAIASLGGLALWIVGPLLYRNWTGHAIAFDPATFHILILVTFANALWYTSSVVPMSTNAHHRLALTLVGASIVSIGVARVLIPLLGLSGAAWSLLCIDVTMIWVVLRTSLRQLDDPFGAFVESLFRIPSLSSKVAPEPAAAELGSR